MQYKTVKRGKFGKAVSSILWGFDDEKGALSQEEIELLHHSLVEEVVPLDLVDVIPLGGFLLCMVPAANSGT